MLWTVKRSDQASITQPMSRILLTTMTPGCPSGPCDLTMAPAGQAGTYRDPRVPIPAGVTPYKGTYALKWDGSGWVATTPAATSSCTVKTGVIASGYTMTSTMRLQFVPASGGVPARVHGTLTAKATGTAQSRKQGCTDFVETEAIGGAATSTVEPATDAAPPLGEYDGTVGTTALSPAELGAAGTPFWLGPMTLGGSASAPTISGLTRTVTGLTRAQGGWTADVASTPFDCQGKNGTTVARGTDATEGFRSLHPIAYTKPGTPILSGTWRLHTNPTASGVAGTCFTSTWEGVITLVPKGATA